MTEEVEALLKKADRSVRSSRRDMADGDFDFAASRAYYAMFYAAEALLLSEGISVSKHSAVIAEVNRLYVATGRLDRRLGASLRKAFELRNTADYEIMSEITQAEAHAVIEDAEAYIAAARPLLSG